MDRKEYYKQLIALYESANEEDRERLNEAGEVVNQSQIADTGSDVMPQDPNAQMQMDPNMDPNAMAGDPNAGMMPQDPSMMMGGGMPDPEDDSLVMEKQKFVKLYSLFESLLDYGTAFDETLETIDTGLLSLERLTAVRSYRQNIESLNEKISNYMINIFNKEPYEKVLYSYIVFRTELVTNIKGLRDILILNKPEEPLPDQQEDGKKSKK